MGMTGDYKPDGTGFEGIEYMLCRPETEFFPDLSKVHLEVFFPFRQKSRERARRARV